MTSINDGMSVMRSQAFEIGPNPILNLEALKPTALQRYNQQ